MHYLELNWPHISYLAGMILEIIGAFLIASRYTNVYWKQLPGVLFSSIWRGERAKDAAIIGQNFGSEPALKVLQGLAFLTVGFVLRTLPQIVALVKSAQ